MVYISPKKNEVYHHRFDIYCCLGRGQWGPLAFKEPWAVGVLTDELKIGENEKNSLFYRPVEAIIRIVPSQVCHISVLIMWTMT